VGAGEQRRGHIDPERLGRPEIDDQLVLGRRLHRKVSRFLALQNAIDIGCGPSVLVDPIRPIEGRVVNQRAAMVVASPSFVVALANNLATMCRSVFGAMFASWPPIGSLSRET